MSKLVQNYVFSVHLVPNTLSFRRVTRRLTRIRVHKETESEDQAQDQTYKLQLLDKKYCKFDEILPYFPESM